MRLLPMLAVLIGLAAAPLTGQERVIGVEEQQHWNAVGRLNRGGVTATSTCTATLVAPALVLTAAHCVAGLDQAEPAALANLTFVAGWNRGDYAAARKAAAVTMAPGYQPGPLTLPGIATDVALVTLDSAITDIAPLPLWSAPLPPEVGFVAYANDRLHAPAVSADCFNVARAAGVRYLACPVVGGNSGAPMLVGLPDAPQVAGTVNARANFGALAADLPDWVADRVAEALQEEPSN